MENIPQAVTDARSEAAKLGSIASNYAGSEYTIPDQLRKTVQEALDYNKDVIGMRSSALADYLAAPSQANAKFGVQQFGVGPQVGTQNPDFIFNPFERNAAIQGYIANESIPFSIANTLLGMREGTAADVIGAGTRAFQAQSAAAQAAAQAARQTYADVLNEYTTGKQLEQEQQKIDISKKTAGGNDLSSTMALLAQLLGGDQQASLPGLNQLGGPIGPPGQSPFDAALEEDKLLGPIIAQQKQKEQAQVIPNAIQNLKVNLAPILQKKGTLGLTGNTPFNFGNLNLSGLNLSPQ